MQVEQSSTVHQRVGGKKPSGLVRSRKYGLCNNFSLTKCGFEAVSRFVMFRTNPGGGDGEKSRQGRLSFSAVSVTIIKICHVEYLNIFLDTHNFRFQM